MKKIYFYLILLLGFGLSSCEEEVTGITLPYREQLVIRAVLQAGDRITNIRVEKTIPPLENYTVEKALVKDAVLIIDDGEHLDTLTYKDGYYNSKLTAQPGKLYKLYAYWKHHKAYGETIVPEEVSFDEVFVEFKKDTTLFEGYYTATVYTYITPNEKYVYTAGTSFDNIIYGNYDEIFTYSRRTSDNKLKINFTFTGGNDTIEVKKQLNNYKFVIINYDKQYYDYFITRYNGNSDDDIFGNVGANVRWNISGDGIGMFIGRNIVVKKAKIN